MDSSTSLSLKANWIKVLNFTKSVISGLVIGPLKVQVGLNIFTDDAQLVFHLNTYSDKSTLLASINPDAIPWKLGNTNTAAGIRMMYRDMFTSQRGDRANVPNIAILITDGESTIDPEQTVPEANNARQKGITVFAIGIALKSQTELEAIGNKPSEEYVFNADNVDALEAIRRKVLDAACKAAVGKFLYIFYFSKH